MQYMLLIYIDEQAMNDAQREACYLESAQFAHQLHERGQYLAAAPLHPNVHGHQRSGEQWKAASDRWSVRGNARTTRRVLHDRRQRS
jgi:hypothetical protein